VQVCLTVGADVCDGWFVQVRVKAGAGLKVMVGAGACDEWCTVVFKSAIS
jgi:hypothetical protein